MAGRVDEGIQAANAAIRRASRLGGAPRGAAQRCCSQPGGPRREPRPWTARSSSTPRIRNRSRSAAASGPRPVAGRCAERPGAYLAAAARGRTGEAHVKHRPGAIGGGGAGDRVLPAGGRARRECVRTAQQPGACWPIGISTAAGRRPGGLRAAREDPAVLDTLGWLYLRKGLVERATSLLEEAHADASSSRKCSSIWRWPIGRPAAPTTPAGCSLGGTQSRGRCFRCSRVHCWYARNFTLTPDDA